MIPRLLRYSYANGRARALAAGGMTKEEIEELSEEGSRTLVLAKLADRYPQLTGRLSAETALRLAFLEFGARIAEELPSRSRELILAYLRRVDVLNLKTLCRGLLRGLPTEAYAPLLIPAKSVGGIEEEALLGGRSIEELAGVLGGHSLAPALRRGLDFPLSRRLPLLEMALDREYWEDIARRIEKLRLLDRSAARELLGLRADLDRLGILRRALDAGFTEEEMLAGIGGPAGEEELPGVSAVERGGGGFSGPPGDEVGLLRRLRGEARRALVAPPFDISVSLAAVLLKELEVRDLCALLGGIRMRCDIGTIRSGLATLEE